MSESGFVAGAQRGLLFFLCNALGTMSGIRFFKGKCLQTAAV